MLSQYHKQQIRNTVEMILHVPGNYRGGILEMTIVLDYNLSRECAENLAKELTAALKSQGEVFRNVRLNTYKWIEDNRIVKEVTAMPLLQMGSYFNEYVQHKSEKSLDELMGQLKLFAARSKLVILLTDGGNKIVSREVFQKNLQPFLEKKIMLIEAKDVTINILRNFNHMEA